MRSYFIFLSRNKLYTFITMFGFAASLMFVVLMAIYTRDQMTVDSTQPNKDRVVRLQWDDNSGNVPPPLGEDLKSRYPEIEAYTRIMGNEFLVENTAKEKISASALVADSSFFTIFSYDFVEGTPVEAMAIRDNVVLSESFARKMFGSQSALGKTIKFCDVDKVMTVGGVIRDFENTVFGGCDMVVPVSFMGNLSPSYVKYYNACNYNLYLLLKPGADLNAKSADMEKYFKDELGFWLFTDDFVKSVHFVPLTDVYFDKMEGTGPQRRGDLTFVMILLAAAAVILVFAVINYINLSVAQSGFRAREMATRRLLGSSVGAIFGKFIVESVAICFMSMAVGLFFSYIAEGTFNEILQTVVNINAELTSANIALALGFVVVLGVISGLVPAYVITRFKPVDVVRGAFQYRTKKVYSKVLIAFQYCITIALIGSTILIVEQTSFMRSRDLGLTTKDLYVVSCYIARDKAAAIRSQLQSVPGVEKVSFATWLPTGGGSNNSFTYNNAQQSFTCFAGDSTMMEMMGIEILQRTGNTADSAVWLNETGFKNLGLTKLVDEFRSEDDAYALGIKGIVRDFHFKGLTSAISSAWIAERMSYGIRNILIRVSSPNATERIKPIIAEFTGGAPFTGQWLDDRVEQWSDTARRQAELVGWLSLMAIIISSLGMLAMATYFIRQRATEIAVRKVFGATRSEVLGQLMWSFLRLVLIGYVVALPAIWYFCSSWLEGFTYRVSLGPVVYIVAGVVAFAIASLTIFWQAYRAATENPINSIKS